MSNPWFKTRTECPACASGRFRTLYQSPYDEPPIKEYLQAFYSPQGMVEAEYLSGAIYVLSECDVCGLVFQMDIPNEALMERLYEHWIDPKKALTQDHNRDLRYYSPYAEEIMRIISYFRTKPSSLCFLDFGMGWGNWALMAKAFGCDSYGTELSLARVAYATEHGVKVITWDEIPQHRFDLVNAEQVFEHIPEPLNTLRHVKMALKPNGVVKISVPPGNDIRRRLALLDWLAPKSSSRSLNPVLLSTSTVSQELPSSRWQMQLEWKRYSFL